MRSVLPPQRSSNGRPSTVAFMASVGAAVTPKSRPGPYTAPEPRRADPVLVPVDACGLLVGDLVDTVVRGGARRRVVAQRARWVQGGRPEHRRRGGVHDPLDGPPLARAASKTLAVPT